MKRAILVFAACVLLLGFTAAAANAAFGLKGLDLAFEDSGGSVVAQAGTHPFGLSTTLAFNTRPEPLLGFEIPDENPKNVVITQMPGLVGSPNVVPPCTSSEFSTNDCPVSSQVGVVDLRFDEPDNVQREGVFSVEPPPGVAMTIGWHVSAVEVPVTVDLRVRQSYPYNVVATLTNTPNVIPVYESKVTLWGVPGDPAHNAERRGIGCGATGCSVSVGTRPFLTTPRACAGPLTTTFSATSWEGSSFGDSIVTHDDADPPQPLGMVGCGNLPFVPAMVAQPSLRASSSPTGLDVTLSVDDEGYDNPNAQVQSDVKEVAVTLPEGMTANPSLAEGLATCSVDEVGRETPSSAPGAGCPEASKIGSVEVETPLLDEQLKGSLYQATPFANLAGNSFVALYIVIKNADLGIVVKQPLRVELDPQTGRLTGIAENVPQLPFSRFRVRFREGARSPLVTPPVCGDHTIEAKLTPWSGGPSQIATSKFSVDSGPGGGACPVTGVPRPFEPTFAAGTLNNQASSFSPFFMRFTRTDREQEMTRIDALLPPGVVGKLAGLAQCSQAAIEAAKLKSGISERANPSCPETARIGRTMSGAGVGPELTYVSGNLYLGGPFGGAPLSIVAIVPGVAGPFDVGTVVIQEALRVNPETAQVEVDGGAGAPIPYILKGIPLRLRDLRVFVDRPEFTLNATSCEPMQVDGRLFGSFLDPLSPVDDQAKALSTRYQAANCGGLGFGPKLSLKLKGGTKRTKHPSLRSLVTYPYQSGPGYSNIGRAVVILPRSLQIDNAHVNNPCTRQQFADEACPPLSILGNARAVSPLLDEPLEGRVYFRSNGGVRDLPDIVADLRGQFRIVLVGFIDTITPKTNPRIRTVFASVPDAPVSQFSLDLFGGKRGLLQNNKNLCAGKQRGGLVFKSHSGTVQRSNPIVRTSCKKR